MIEEEGQNHVVFTFLEKQSSGEVVLKNASDEEIVKFTPTNDYSILALSSEKLVSGDYSLYVDGVKRSGFSGDIQPETPMGPPEGFDGEMPPFDHKEPPKDVDKKAKPSGRVKLDPENLTDIFTVKDGGNMFVIV